MENITLDGFLKYCFLSDLKVAPGGRDVAFVQAQADREENSYLKDLWLLKDGKTPLRLTGDSKAGSYIWEDSHTLLFTSERSKTCTEKKQRLEEYTELYRIDTRGGEAVRAFTLPLNATPLERVRDDLYLFSVQWDMGFSKAYLLEGKAKEALLREKREEQDYHVIDEQPFYFNGKGFINKTRTSLFLYNSATDSLKSITPQTFALGSARLNEARNTILYTGENYTVKQKNKGGIYTYNISTGETSTLLPAEAYDIYDAFWWEDGILFIATDGKRFGLNENPQFYLLSSKTGEVSLFAPFEQAVGSSVGSDCRLGGGKSWEISDGRLYFTATIRNASHIYCLDKNGRPEPVFTQEGSVDCMDIQGDTLYFVGMQNMKLQEIYSYTPGAETLTPLTAVNEEALRDKYVAKPQKLTFENDGVDLDGWVLEPKGYSPEKKYPAILDIHGGPKTVYGEVFYHEMQFWANEGYFVFFCNPRGGDGRGNEFADLRGKYGTIDYSDIMSFCDVVLEKYPQIDDKRLAVTGGSYGGFMTNWIIGHTSRFAAAASQRSIANWIGFGFTSDIGESFGNDQMGLGENENVWNSHEKLWLHSPLKYLASCTTPTLFIHSDEDYRCPLSEGYQMYGALQQLGVETRMCIFRGENHELSRSGKPLHRIRRLREITDWFKNRV